jgi:hypothetical protein
MEQKFKEWLEQNFNDIIDNTSMYEYKTSSRIDRYTNYESRVYVRVNDISKIENLNNLYVEHNWSMGGTYGNCWDDSMSSSEGEIKPEFTSLDTIVDLINPNLSYMKYRTKVIPLVESYTTSNGDYYGGSTTTGHERVNIYKLWEALNAL